MPPDPPDDRSVAGAFSSDSARAAPPSLEDLRAVVNRAAATIRQLRQETDRLQAENDRLRERVRELEENPGAGLEQGTALLLDDDPDTLRQRIDRFIEALDTHLTDS